MNEPATEPLMRLGTVLPTFMATAGPALDAARAAEEAGLDGVFCYDHIWPMARPGDPAISPYPVLGHLAVTTTRLRLGTLVARVGLVPDEVLITELLTIDELSGGRLIAGVGAGDHKSRPENEAYGIEFAPADERRAAVAYVVRELHDAGVEAWIGGGSRETNALARETGATLNLWGATVSKVAAAAAEGPVTWGGPLPADPEEARLLFDGLRAAGAKWAVVAWPGQVERILDAAGRAI